MGSGTTLSWLSRMSTSARRRGLAAIAVVGVLLLGAGTAVGGGAVATDGGEAAPGPLTLTAGPGEDNRVTLGLDGSGGAYEITDTAGIPDPTPPSCIRTGAGSLRCPAAAVASISVDLKDGDDSFEVVGGGIAAGVPLDLAP